MSFKELTEKYSTLKARLAEVGDEVVESFFKEVLDPFCNTYGLTYVSQDSSDLFFYIGNMGLDYSEIRGFLEGLKEDARDSGEATLEEYLRVEYSDEEIDIIKKLLTHEGETALKYVLYCWMLLE